MQPLTPQFPRSSSPATFKMEQPRARARVNVLGSMNKAVDSMSSMAQSTKNPAIKSYMDAGVSKGKSMVAKATDKAYNTGSFFQEKL